MTLLFALTRLFSKPAAVRPAKPASVGATGLSDSDVQRISRDTQRHTLASILSRQIVDAQFRLSGLTCDEARFAQSRMIADLKRHRAREVGAPWQVG
ncbi:hypothetical protein [Shimia sediminis]|uniref:hypothetical protein n=1 Tax=Shimia sediminis TaxID=2497945 RepID=UPI000F8D219C|nr:hypothetical protein [Shimia sediminis]